MENINEFTNNIATEPTSEKPKYIYGFNFPIIIQRYKMKINEHIEPIDGVGVHSPDLGVGRFLNKNLNQTHKEFCQKLGEKILEVDALAHQEFERKVKKHGREFVKNKMKRDIFKSLDFDFSQRYFTPVAAAKFTNYTARTLQSWCKSGRIKSKLKSSNNEKRNHYLIPFASLEPFLSDEFMKNPFDFIS